MVISSRKYQLHRRNKFNNVRTVYKGVKYDSKAEAHYAQSLDDDPSVLWWLRQVGFDLTEDHRYRCDFVVARVDGAIHAVEVKGRVTPQTKKHIKMWRKYGVMPLHIVYKDRMEIVDDGLEPT